MTDKSKLKILLVDNNAAHALALGESIQSLGHAVAGLARRADDAICMHREINPDLVLLDVDLPGDNSINAAEQMARHAGTPVIITGSMACLEKARRAAEAGICSYLIKPVSERVLDLSIKSAMKISQIEAFIQIQLTSLQDELINQKNLSRAIGHLMDSMSLDEQAAREHLHHQSKQAGITSERMAARISRQLDTRRASAG